MTRSFRVGYVIAEDTNDDVYSSRIMEIKSYIVLPNQSCSSKLVKSNYELGKPKNEINRIHPNELANYNRHQNMNWKLKYELDKTVNQVTRSELLLWAHEGLSIDSNLRWLKTQYKHELHNWKMFCHFFPLSIKFHNFKRPEHILNQEITKFLS